MLRNCGFEQIVFRFVVSACFLFQIHISAGTVLGIQISNGDPSGSSGSGGQQADAGGEEDPNRQLRKEDFMIRGFWHWIDIDEDFVRTADNVGVERPEDYDPTDPMGIKLEHKWRYDFGIEVIPLSNLAKQRLGELIGFARLYDKNDSPVADEIRVTPKMDFYNRRFRSAIFLDLSSEQNLGERKSREGLPGEGIHLRLGVIDKNNRRTEFDSISIPNPLGENEMTATELVSSLPVIVGDEKRGGCGVHANVMLGSLGHDINKRFGLLEIRIKENGVKHDPKRHTIYNYSNGGVDLNFLSGKIGKYTSDDHLIEFGRQGLDTEVGLETRYLPPVWVVLLGRKLLF